MGVNHGKWNLRELYAEELYKHAIPDSQGLHWYAVDDEGVFSKSNGGSGTVENGQVLCRLCNLEKSNKWKLWRV